MMLISHRARVAGGHARGQHLTGLVIAALAAVACGTAAPSGGSIPTTSSPTASEAPRSTAVPPAGSASPANSAPASSAGALRPGFTGTGVITVTLDGAEHRLANGQCGVEQFPDGAYAYGFNAGTPSVGDGGPDYVGIVVELPSDQPDGTYDDVLAVASLGGIGFNIGDAELTVADGGASGTLTGSTRPGNRPLEATFTC